ncbi:uncharacterized protein DS421_12g388230 [Arachis hypogaea]|nr:uncharacterized protein DS421_12g388230 [Arachis hypogaea]
MANKKLVIVFVFIATTLPSPQALHDEFDQENMSPYYYDIQKPSVSPLPSIELSVDIEAPNNDDEDIDQNLYDSSASAPTPSPTGFKPSGDIEDSTPYSDDNDDDAAVVSPRPQVLPFNYTAEDDAGEITNESFHHEGYHVENKNVVTCGILIGAVCLVGLGGFVYKKNINQKRKQYQHLFNNKRGDI